MILLNKEGICIFDIDRDLVIHYKKEGDIYLVSIRHDMTKQLVSYKSYYDLQQINNSFFKILNNLLKCSYYELGDFENDVSMFHKNCKIFIKNCVGIVPEDVYLSIKNSIERLELMIDKLSYICKNFCYNEEDKNQ